MCFSCFIPFALVENLINGGTQKGWVSICGVGGGWWWPGREAASKLWLAATKLRSYWLAQRRHWAAFHHTLMRSPDLLSSARSPKAHCNCTFSNGVGHASTPALVMTITIMSSGSTGAVQSSVILGDGMLVNCCWRLKGCNTMFDYDTFSHWKLVLNHRASTVRNGKITHTNIHTLTLRALPVHFSYSRI